MARKRMIDPSIWRCEQFFSLTYRQRVLYIGLFSNADDEGRQKASLKLVRRDIFGLDEISLSEVEADLSAIAKTGLIKWWISKTDGQPYILHPNWDDYQKVDNPQPSRCPVYQGEPLVGVDSNPSETDPGSIPDRSGIDQESIPDQSALIEKNRIEDRSSSDFLPPPPAEGDDHPSIQPPKPTQLFTEETMEYKLAAHQRAKILEVNPRAKVPEESPKALRKWCKTFDLMIRIDRRDPREIAAVINRARSDPFWQTVILSPDNLRRHYDRIMIQAGRARGRDAPAPLQHDDTSQARAWVRGESAQ
jgi:hypothetical protein